jgi:hypothetical protein
MTTTVHHTERDGSHCWVGRPAAASPVVRASSHRRGLWLAMLLPLAIVPAGCGGDSPAATASVSASPSSSAPPSNAAAPEGTEPSAVPEVSINARAPLTQTVDAGFDPSFTLRIPARWTSVLRDVSAFQVYTGNEDFEITFDHTYRSKESLAHALARLRSTEGLSPGPVTTVDIGDRHGRGFMASSQGAVQFLDSGFHTNEGSRLEVFAVPAQDGTTVTVFVTSGGDPLHGLDALGPLARRIFRTVAWH